MERKENDDRENSSQHSTMWKQDKAKPLLSPKLGAREHEDKKERGMRMFKRIKWKQSAALDRLIYSSQPDLLFSDADSPSCDKPSVQPSSRHRTASGNKQTVLQLVQGHHKSLSVGSACVDGLSEEPPCPSPFLSPCGGDGKTAAVAPELHAQEAQGGGAAVGAGSQNRGPSTAMYKLDVLLKRGHNLAIRDRGGTSDPYVKFKLGGKEVFKSKTIHKNLNPVWDEKITLTLDSLSEPLYIKVFDYDFGLQDDFMGSVYLNLDSLEQQRVLSAGFTQILGHYIFKTWTD